MQLLTPITALLAGMAISACSQPTSAPSNAQIEALAMRAQHGQQRDARKQLEVWAKQGLPTAQRELAITLAQTPSEYAHALHWYAQAGAAGDAQASFLLGEACYGARLGLAKNPQRAWGWYRLAAAQGNATAALMLARMAKYGEAGPADLNDAVRWLARASALGNAQAMFLLSNAYASGLGVGVDADSARRWLELAAARDYPVAIQALALTLEQGDAHTARDSTRARHLIKEASDERLMHWNQYQ